MPKEFLSLANSLRCADNPSNTVMLSRKVSAYNAKKTKGKCEECGRKATDIHHMNPQKNANENGFIGTFHKNHKANLMSVCKDCHDKGYKTREINM